MSSNRSMLNRTTKVIILCMLLMIAFSAVGCKSSRKDELHAKLQEGEQLLQEEKYEAAYLLYVDLLEDYQDNLTIMEKIDYAEVMKKSRQNLTLAKEAMEENNFQNAMVYLDEIPELDVQGLAQKEQFINSIKGEYIEKSDAYLAEKSFEDAMDVLREYAELLGEDQEVEKKLELILLESKKPVEAPKKVIVIDVAHQEIPDLEEETIGPDSEVMESKVTQGTRGILTKVPEYVLNLDVALSLKQVLTDAGYQVYLTRETHQVNLSNRERSAFANEMNADLFLRLHANSSKDRSKQGIEILYPSEANPYVGQLSQASAKFANAINDELIKSTGAKSQGVLPRENMAEHNFSKSPVITLLMGYMTNKEEDALLQTPEYQQKIAQGIKNGIEIYFETQ